MSVTKPAKLSLEKALNVLRKPGARLVRLHSNNGGAARGDTWWTHIPTGGRRSPIEAAILKSLGVRAGSPDLLIIRAGQPVFMELKGAKPQAFTGTDRVSRRAATRGSADCDRRQH